MAKKDKFNTMIIGDIHIQDCDNSNYGLWKYDMFIYCFKQINKHIKAYGISKLVLVGDVFDYIPKHNAMELFSKFMHIIKDNNLEIIMIAGNHEVLSGNNGKEYFQDKLKEYFKLNYNITVLDDYKHNGIYYCSHKHIKKLEKLNKPLRLVYSHFRSNIAPIIDEIDVQAINQNVELCIAGDIHHRNQKDNIVYTSSPIDTHFDSNNVLDSHTPSVLLLNEETLEWKWEEISKNKFRKIKKIFVSTDDFLNNVQAMRDDFKENNNFYKCDIQDLKVKLNQVKPNLYEDFCTITKSKIDLDFIKEDKKISNDIIKTLSTTNVSESLKDFILKNNDRADMKNKIEDMLIKYGGDIS